MAQTLVFALLFFIPAELTITSWAIFPFLEEKMRLPLPAWLVLRYCWVFD